MWKEAFVTWFEILCLNLREGTEENQEGIQSGVLNEAGSDQLSNTNQKLFR
jgi:hypothetical protein